MTSTFLFFLKSYWQQIAIGILVAVIAYGVVDYFQQRERIASLEKDLDAMTQKADNCAKKVGTFEKAAEDGKKNIKAAEEKRVVVIKEVEKRVEVIKLQEAPKECEGAIKWAIENKSQLSW